VASVRYLLAILAITSMQTCDARACQKTVRWYDDAPYSYRAPSGEVAGFDADLMRAVLKRTGCTAVFVNMPWARALIELEAGRLDILSGTFRNPERELYAYFSIPALQSRNVLYWGPAARTRYQLGKLDELVGTRFQLGVQIGVSYGDNFEALKANPRFRNNLVPVTLRRNAWRMMELGRIDGMIVDEASAEVELHQLGLDGVLKPSGIIASSNTSMVAFSKRSISPQFVESFNKALQTMIDNGEYRRIRERYLHCPQDSKVLGCS
jgi:polar amino acid transport system substrate-binding protein